MKLRALLALAIMLASASAASAWTRYGGYYGHGYAPMAYASVAYGYAPYGYASYGHGYYGGRNAWMRRASRSWSGGGY